MALAVVLCVVSAGCYNAGIVLQASVARHESSGRTLKPSLITQLARTRAWLAGTALNLAAWGAQVWALTLAPLTFVQPALGLGVFFLLAFAGIVLHERPSLRDVGGAAALVAGIALLARSAPARGVLRDRPGEWIVAGAALAVVALVPYVVRTLRMPGVLAASAGFAYAITGVSSEIVARMLPAHRFAFAFGAAAFTGVFALLGFLSEMSALVRGSVTTVVPIMLVLDTVIPVALAPTLFGERWPRTPTGIGILLCGLVFAVGGTAMLATSRPAASIRTSAATASTTH